MTNTGSTEHGDRKGKILKTCVALLILLILIKGCLPTTVRTNISDYETDLESVRGAADYLPKPDSLSGYKNIKYSYKRKDHILFTAIGMALFVEYDAEIYNNKKAEVLTGYEYLAEPIKASFNHENYSLPVTKG